MLSLTFQISATTVITTAHQNSSSSVMDNYCLKKVASVISFSTTIPTILRNSNRQTEKFIVNKNCQLEQICKGKKIA